MDTAEKLRILAGAAKYDVSCSSSGSGAARGDGVGNTSLGGICHSWTSDGRCVSLLKILMSNECRYDCAYCVNRCSNQVERATFTVGEMVAITMNFYRRNYIEGLFLSSGVYAAPDTVMADLVEVASLLRRRHRFNGYIHLKVIPGASADTLTRAGRVADRVSVNIELPSEKSLLELAPQKSRAAIIKPMAFLGESYRDYLRERRLAGGSPRRSRPPPFAPAGQSTQLIIGASGESDRQILALGSSLYNKFALKRVYFSAYSPVGADSRLPVAAKSPPLVREHRLYQADWLMRFYGFDAAEILAEETPFLDLEIDPKLAWALRNPQFFPVDAATATYEALLRVPGLGVTSARRIVRARSAGVLRGEDFAKIGVVMKRAAGFLSLRGRQLEAGLKLLETPGTVRNYYQPSLFTTDSEIPLLSQ